MCNKVFRNVKNKNKVDNFETYKSTFESQSIGWQCNYYDLDNGDAETNTKPENGAMTCAATNPSNLSPGNLYCTIDSTDSEGSVTCADGYGMCTVYPDVVGNNSWAKCSSL